MSNRIVFATNNKNKIEEVNSIIGSNFNILSLDDIDCKSDLPEEQKTLVGNALQKARYVYDKFGVNCFSDDTGLEVEALNGSPGVQSARYAGDEKDAEKNIKKLLSEMENIANRRARFVTVVALVFDDKDYFFDGIVNGRISNEIAGRKGFGYDPVFIPDSFDDTFAQMPSEVKNRVSHRGIAFEKLKTFLENYF